MNSFRMLISISTFTAFFAAGPALAMECSSYPNLPCSVEDDEVVKAGFCVAKSTDAESDEKRLIRKVEELTGRTDFSEELRQKDVRDSGMGELAHAYALVIAGKKPVTYSRLRDSFRRDYLDRYKLQAEARCNFTGKSHVQAIDEPRLEEFTQVVAAYLTHPEMLDNGDPACAYAKKFMREVVFPKKDAVCAGGHPKKWLAAQPKKTPQEEECEEQPDGILGKNGEDLADVAAAADLAAQAEQESSAQAKRADEELAKYKAKDEAGGQYMKENASKFAKENAEAEAKLRAEEKREEERAVKLAAERKERRRKAAADRDWDNSLISMATVFSAAAPTMIKMSLDYQAVQAQADYIKQMNATNAANAALYSTTTTTTSPIQSGQIILPPTEAIPVVPTTGGTGSGTGR